MKNVKFAEWIPVGISYEKYMDYAQKCGLKLFETFTEPEHNVYVLEGNKFQFLRYYGKHVIKGEFVNLKVAIGILKAVIFYKGD